MQQIITNGNTSKLSIPDIHPVVVQKSEQNLKYPKSQLKKLIHIILLRYPQKVKLKHSHRLIHYQMKLSALTLKTMKSQKLINIGKKVMVKTHCTHALLRRIPLWCSFSNTSRNDAQRLNEVKFELLPQDFVRKVKDPQLVAIERTRTNYVFQISLRPCLYYLHFFHEQF